jgi:hypothetical protein
MPSLQSCAPLVSADGQGILKAVIGKLSKSVLQCYQAFNMEGSLSNDASTDQLTDHVPVYPL